MKGFNKTTPPYKTYTIVWNEVSDPSQFFVRYEDDAVGLTQGSGAFDDFFGYSAVLLNTSGEETAEMKQSGGVFTGAMSTLGNITSGDNVMIKFPRRGIKMSKSGTQVTLSITDDPNKEGYQYYAHTKGSTAKDTLYLGAYKMVSGYKSLSGKTPLVNQTRGTFRAGIRSTYYGGASGIDNYSQVTIYPRWYINALYMMKYGNPNSQSVVGVGCTNLAANTGGTNSQTNATYGSSSSSVQVRLFGLEDRWGNADEFLDSCWYNSSKELEVDTTNTVLDDGNYVYPTSLGIPSAGYIGGIAGTNDKMFMSTSAGGSGSTYYTDYFDVNTYKVISAGSYGGGVASGIFRIGYITSGNTSNGYGARLMYL